MNAQTNITASPKSSPSKRFFSPLAQAIAVLVLSLAGIAGTKLLGMDTSYQFLASFIGIVVYSLINVMISIFHESFVRYTMVSWWLYAGLTGGLLLAARFISGVSIRTHAEFIQMLISLTIFYVVTSILVRAIRAVWQFAENDKN
jgi:hypothetical protein